MLYLTKPAEGEAGHVAGWIAWMGGWLASWLGGWVMLVGFLLGLG